MHKYCIIRYMRLAITSIYVIFIYAKHKKKMVQPDEKRVKTSGKF